MADQKTKSFLAKARSWASKKKLFGAQAFLKYVILTYVECLNEESDQFIFKGGNLLWVYIGTPRQTMDLDLATRTLEKPEEIRAVLERACTRSEKSGIHLKLSHFELIEGKEFGAAAARILYSTDQGVSNGFEMDIVFATSTDTGTIPSPLGSGIPLSAASVENIITDKISASANFGSGNTRLKDFDDLLRISRSTVEIDAKRLAALLRKRNVPRTLDLSWISQLMRDRWKRHIKPYKDLPGDIDDVFKEVNTWLQKLLKE